LVLDTAVLVAALRSLGGASWQLVDGALTRRFTLLLSVPLALEYEAVLIREEHRKVHGLSVQEVIEVVNALIRISESVQIRFLWRPLLPDPADDMVLETAVNGRADGLVTFNEADFAPAASDQSGGGGENFCLAHRGVFPRTRSALEPRQSAQTLAAGRQRATPRRRSTSLTGRKVVSTLPRRKRYHPLF
jgi:putative PIN family toxin of toxin-antitoxin system